MRKTLIQGHCLEELVKFPFASVDMVVCDLPYFQVIGEDWDNAWSNIVDYLSWCRNMMEQYQRILKNDTNLFIFTTRRFTTMRCYIVYILNSLFSEKRIIIWPSKRGFNNIKMKNESKCKEYPDDTLKDGIAKEKITHPTQKPLALIEIGSNPGDLVLDNCAGNSITSVACKNLGRDYTLIEKEQKYIGIVNQRLNQQ